MGHAWCKEKTSKAQDSKSPLDRVFVRCAHTIYPSLKEEGSVLGGATQRVTSSEIGYAGSPPRDVLTRGRSIDSVDRPFHPSDWVDVNLEVPSTPRASSVVTNLTVDTSLHPATSPTSSCSNINKNGTPVPPPRRKKRNRGRPLPPKPDEGEENSNSNSKHGEHGEEPLYSSVKSPKASEDEQEEECRPDKSESRRIKEIYEHKVNGTGKVISSDMVSGKRSSWTEEKKAWRISELSHQEKKIPENEEYDSFVRNQSVKDSSTPNHLGKRTSKESEKQIKDISKDIVNESEAVTSNTRSKNYSTVSLPNYDELDVKRHSTKEIQDVEECEEKKVKPKRPIRCSTVSLPAENCLSPFSQKTSVRLEDYIPTTKDLPAYQVLENLECTENGDVEDEFVKYDSNKLQDWDLNDIRNCDLNHQRRLSHEFLSLSETLDEKNVGENEDVVDFAENVETDERERKILPREEISDRYVTRSPVTLQKPEAFGKASSPILDDHSRGSSDWMANQNGPHLRYFEAPTLSATCRSSPGCNISDSGISRQPFYLNEEKHRSALDTIAGEGGRGGGGGGGSCRNGAIMEESDRLKQSRMIFSRSLSNESEPFDDTYESKELRDHTSSTGKLIKTISEESLPREMLEEVDRELDDFFDEKLAKDVHNKLKKECEDMKVNVKTPPPSPEPKIQAEIVDNDHSTLLKVLKEEAAEESNLSSMTPSLTELEAALSDMLEKEEPQEETVKSEDKNDGIVTSKLSKYIEKPIEPEIVPIEKNPSSFTADSLKVTPEPRGRTGDKSLVDEDLERKEIDISVFPGDVLEEKKPVMKSRKVSFCAWEENGMMEIDLKNDLEHIQKSGDLGKSSVSERIEEQSRIDEETRIESGEHVEISSNTVESLACRMELPPEKPSRLHRNPEELADHTEIVPTPPRRKRRNSLGPMKKEFETSQNESSSGIDTDLIDRLI